MIFSLTVLMSTLMSCQAQTPADTAAHRKALSPEAVRYIETHKDSLDLNVADNVIYLGYLATYRGNDKIGNEIMDYGFSFKKNATGDDYQELSVQNTKNGNYVEAIAALEKAVTLDRRVNGYYGWVLLYYYHDYVKALATLEKYDALTPNFSDAPMGEDIHFLKGLCWMQIKNYPKAIAEFTTCIDETTKSHGEDWVDLYTYVYKGICLHRQGKYREAIFNYDKTIKYYKDCTEAYYYKGMAYVALAQKNEACENFNKARETAGRNNFHYDVYVELFDAVYMQDIEKALNVYCR